MIVKKSSQCKSLGLPYIFKREELDTDVRLNINPIPRLLLACYELQDDQSSRYEELGTNLEGTSFHMTLEVLMGNGNLKGTDWAISTVTVSVATEPTTHHCGCKSGGGLSGVGGPAAAAPSASFSVLRYLSAHLGRT